MRKFISFPVEDLVLFKTNLLHWASSFSKCCVLDSNHYHDNKNELIAAVGCIDELLPQENSFAALKKFHAEKKDWLFGHLSYDLKNETEKLSSDNFDGVEFPQMHFFCPKYIVRLSSPHSPARTTVQSGGPLSPRPNDSSGRAKGREPGQRGVVEIGFLPELSSEKEVNGVLSALLNSSVPSALSHLPSAIHSRLSKAEYIRTIEKIKQHVHRGDIYELNYCMEFFFEKAEIDPLEIFLRLNGTSQTPFSSFYRMGDKYLLCASPERFLKKTGNKIISQPIKGTSKRGRNVSEDTESAENLFASEKEKSENVMIVDLVRNDLSRCCDNVKVDELCGVYTFKQWHQMVSTVSGELRANVHFTDLIKNTFPMGSMTGAPKVKAMELIEKYEKTKRGLYSGAVGYITPQGNFDFNVVIRSILHNASSGYLSFQVGSAITANSIPENEYEECLLKAKGMFSALSVENYTSQETNSKEYRNSLV